MRNTLLISLYKGFSPLSRVRSEIRAKSIRLLALRVASTEYCQGVTSEKGAWS